MMLARGLHQVDIRIPERFNTESTFPEDWAVETLDAIGVFRSGGVFPLVFQGEESGDYPATEFPTGSIVFAKIGAAVFLERKRLLSKTSCLDNNMMGFIFVDSRACRRYFYYIFLNIERGEILAPAPRLPPPRQGHRRRQVQRRHRVHRKQQSRRMTNPTYTKFDNSSY